MTIPDRSLTAPASLATASMSAEAFAVSILLPPLGHFGRAHAPPGTSDDTLTYRPPSPSATALTMSGWPSLLRDQSDKDLTFLSGASGFRRAAAEIFPLVGVVWHIVGGTLVAREGS